MIQRRTMLAALPAAAMIGRAHAQEAWPQRPIRIVVGFAAGGATDITTRTLAPKLQSILGQSLIIDNRPGG
ncbi:MAG TPA: tripartite tricarboxylate transporter substrate binding protein, partial [Roseomonas sp.]